MTTGCTIEAHNFQRDLPKYDALNAVVLGVSLDTVESHKTFCTKDSLTFKLLADPDHKVIDAYGVPVSRRMAVHEVRPARHLPHLARGQDREGLDRRQSRTRTPTTSSPPSRHEWQTTSTTQQSSVKQTQKGPDLSRGARAFLLAWLSLPVTTSSSSHLLCGLLCRAFFAGLLDCLLCCFLSCQGSTSRSWFLFLECSCCRPLFSKRPYRRAEHSTSSRQISMSFSCRPFFAAFFAAFFAGAFFAGLLRCLLRRPSLRPSSRPSWRLLRGLLRSRLLGRGAAFFAAAFLPAWTPLRRSSTAAFDMAGAGV